MSNLLQNAGFLDGVTSYAQSGGSLAIDESVVGAPGRAVLAVSQARTAGQGLEVAGVGVAVAAGEMIEVSGRAANSDGGLPTLELEVRSGEGTLLGLTQIPRLRSGEGAPRRGLARSLAEHYGRLPAPATGFARVRLVSIAAGSGVHTAWLSRPYLGRPLGPRRAPWSPGSHLNPDLQLASWPAVLGRFQAAGLPEPLSNLDDFAGDAGLPATRVLYDGLRHRMQGRLRTDDEGLDTLERFYAANRRFYLLKPDTDQLCFATWLKDGQPRVSEARGATLTVEVGLQLEIA